MSVFNHSTRTRAVARALFPAGPDIIVPGRHGRDGGTVTGDPVARARLRYRATPFYLKIEGLKGPRQPRYV